MINFNSELERRIFEKIAPEYEKKGYEFINPTDVKVPSGKWRYIPDFVAKKGERHVAIEVKSKRTPSVERSLEQLKGMIESDESWSFKVFYAEDEIADKNLTQQDTRFINDALIEVREAHRLGMSKAAFLLAWGAFEAAARYLHSRIFAKPQTPGRIITILAERGVVTPGESERLRELAQKRNSLIHGVLDVELDPSSIEFVESLVRRLIDKVD